MTKHSKIKISKAGRPRKPGQREANGQPIRKTAEQLRQEAADNVRNNLQPRVIAMGWKLTPETLATVNQPIYACNAGRCIAATFPGNTDQQARLFNAVKHMRQAYHAWCMASGIPLRHPKLANLMAAPEPMQADSTTPPLDLRTDVERYRAAKATMVRIDAWLDQQKRMAGQVKLVVLDDEAVTDAGAFIAGITLIANGLGGNQ